MREICLDAGLDEKEITLTKYHVDNPDQDSQPFYESTAYTKLEEHFCNLGEMPYKVAKAIETEPDIWILDRLSEAIQSDG
jgi:hypothetical protein